MRILNLALPIGLALSSLCAPSAYAGAPDNNAATESVPRALPYEGHLAVDGVPLNGNVDVEFSLYGQSVVGAAHVFRETLTVPFVNGSFSVLLGAGQVAMSNAILDADDLYLGVSINGTTLSGRQRIVPVPRALWSAHAADFDVKGDLTVDGAATINGAATLRGGLDVTGPTALDGDVTVGGTAALNGDVTVGGNAALNGGAAILNGATVTGATVLNNALTVTGSAALNGGAAILNGATVGGGATVSGDTTLNNGLTVTGATALNGGATVNGALAVNGASTLGNNLTMNGGTAVLRFNTGFATVSKILRSTSYSSSVNETTNMTATAASICFLVTVHANDLAGEDICTIYSQQDIWKLRNGSMSSCIAYCLSFN